MNGLCIPGFFFYFRHKFVECQHGFLKGRSVETNICSFLNYSAPVVTNRGQVDCIFFDMSKAFDKVNHELLLHKLSSYGCCPELCNWFRSYLSSRLNTVRVDNSHSDHFFSTSGVPQGSILGPLLFLIFINDLPSYVDNAQILLFADDIKLFMNIHSSIDCNALQHDVSQIAIWCAANSLSLNPLKTKVVSFSRRHTIIDCDYVLEGMPIKRLSVIKDLGVYLDNVLTFTAHVSFVVGSATRMLGVISRITKHFNNPASLIRLFCALVRSRLEFASVAWNALNKTQALNIENVQKRLIRIVYDRYSQRRFYFDYEFLLKKVSMTNLSDRRAERDLVFFHKLVNGVSDSGSLLSDVNLHVPSRPTRNHCTFYVNTVCDLSPLSRCQLLFNRINNAEVDIFSDSRVFAMKMKVLVANL